MRKKFFVFIVFGIVNLKMTVSWAGAGSHGADDVSRYLNLVKFYIVPDIIHTVTIDQMKREKHNEKILEAYRRFSESLLQDGLTIDFQKGSDAEDGPWISTDDEVGSSIFYSVAGYHSRFGKNYDPLVITQHVFHEIGHWYKLKMRPNISEDEAWGFAYAVTKAYQEVCEKMGDAPIFSTSSCLSYKLLRRTEIVEGRLLHPYRRHLESSVSDASCLESYNQSVAQLRERISGQEESIELASHILNFERKDHISDPSWFIEGVIDMIGMVSMVLPAGLFPEFVGPEIFVLAATGAGGIVASPFIGQAIHNEITRANAEIDAYNGAIDQAVWALKKGSQSPFTRVLYMDRQFVQALLYDAETNSLTTLNLGVNSDNPMFKHLKISGQLNLSEINHRLRTVAKSKQLCAPGLFSSADLGMVIVDVKN